MFMSRHRNAVGTVKLVAFAAEAAFAFAGVGLSPATLGQAIADAPAQAPSQIAAPITDGPRDLAPLLEPLRAKANLPALAGVVMRGSTLVASGAVGIRAVGSAETVTIDDQFHLGSCTKSMTATMIARLVDQGTMRWDMTIGDVFPDEKSKFHPAFTAVRLDQLLTNRGGVPGDVDPRLWAQLWKRHGTPTEQRMQLIEGLLGGTPPMEPVAEPGSKFIYSNSGFAIAGAMAERMTGEAWEALMQRLIFEPLSMTSAGFGAPGSKDMPNLIDEPRGHRTGERAGEKSAEKTGAKGGPSAALEAVPPGPLADNPPAIGPAGIVHASLPDWGKYVALHLLAEREDPEAFKLVSKKSFAKLHQGIAGEGAAAKPSDTDGYAMGWGVTKRPWADGRVLTHNGSNTMWYCVVWIAPKKNFAVLVATNAASPDASKACDAAASALIQDEMKQH